VGRNRTPRGGGAKNAADFGAVAEIASDRDGPAAGKVEKFKRGFGGWVIDVHAIHVNLTVPGFDLSVGELSPELEACGEGNILAALCGLGV
jgi:hypothetical protein